MKRLSLTAWIFIGMAAGVALGVFAPGFAKQLGPVGSVFLRLIRSIIAPLIFATLVSGVAGGGDMKQMGRIGVKAILYFEIVTTLALFLGLAAVNLVRPGLGVPIQRTSAEAALTQAPATFASVLEHIFPTSLIDAMARNDVLQVVVFAFLFGAACAAIGAKAAAGGGVLQFAGGGDVPLHEVRDVPGAAGRRGGHRGHGGKQGHRRAVRAGQADSHDVRGARSICIVLVLGPALLLFRIPVRRFYRAVREPFLIAFSTASSEAALPLALENMEEFGVPEAHRGLRDSDRLQLQPGTAARCISRWPRCSWRRPPVCSSRSASNC